MQDDTKKDYEQTLYACWPRPESRKLEIAVALPLQFMSEVQVAQSTAREDDGGAIRAF